MIKARIITDTVSPVGARITTWVLTYPRFIHAEFMTHRVFSRNAASSRAIPIEKMLKAIMDNPAMPEFWGANQKGMQAAVELEEAARNDAIQEWLLGRDKAVTSVSMLDDIGCHKQIANRITEPWGHITVLATATEYDNFFGLRAHKDAQPEFQVLAYTMLRAYLTHTPTPAKFGDWHIPFGEQMPKDVTIEQKLKIATARAARISYRNFEGIIDPVKDYDLHDKLAASGHWSPFEHCAYAADIPISNSNFMGWVQYRKNFRNENPRGVNLQAIWDAVPEWVHDAIERNDSTFELG